MALAVELSRVLEDTFYGNLFHKKRDCCQVFELIDFLILLIQIKILFNFQKAPLDTNAAGLHQVLISDYRNEYL